MITATILPDGNLEITADDKSRDELSKLFLGVQVEIYCDPERLVQDEIHPDWRFVHPDAIGTLTGSPILCEEPHQPLNSDDGQTWDFKPDAIIYWFPGFMLRDPWRELVQTGRVLFTKAEWNKCN